MASSNRLTGMDFREFRYTFRRLGRSPGLSLVSTVTIALGIGTTAAVFSVVHGVLLKPLPFDDPESLVSLWHTAPGLGFADVHQSPATYFTYRDEATSFEDIGMWDNGFVSVTGVDEPERVEAIYVTDGTLPLLRVRPAVGRLFSPQDDTPGSPGTVILSHGYWQRRFGGDDGILGRTVTIDGVPREIVGVLPQDFRFLRYDPAVWLPFRFDRSEVYVGDFSYQALARLKPAITLAEANAEIDRLLPATVEKFPRGMTLEMLRDGQFGASVRPLDRDVIGDVGEVLWVLFGTVGLVLVIACANVANLLLVRADGRQREIALRTAMGADRLRLAADFFIESVSLALLGGAVGLGLAFGGVRLLVGTDPESLPRLHEIGIDPAVVGFTLVVSILAGLFFGAIPMWRYGRGEIAMTLERGGRSSEGRERQLGRRGLVVSQLALSLVLLVSSGLMIRSFRALRNVDPGFVRPSEVLSVKISIPEAEIEDPVQAVRAHERILESIEQIPGVHSAGLSSSITMDGWNSADGVYVEDFPTPEGQLPAVHRFKWISEGYFRTMGNPLLAGRDVTWNDVHGTANVAVVTENFATTYWEDPPDALGKRIRQSPDQPWREIVGVVGNVHDDGVGEDATPTVYWPMLLNDFQGDDVFTRRTMGYAIRTSRLDDPAFLDEIRATVWAVNPNLPIASVATLSELLERSMARTSFTLVMLTIASVVALVLGTVGIYGVISYAVSRRTREIGVRMAVGADRRDVSRLVIGDGLRLTVLGVLLGLVAASALTRLMSSLLFGVAPVDLPTYAAVSFTLASIALAASYLPARRAASIEPVEALRGD